MSATQSLPVYIQISEMLIRDVQAGRLMDGARLPPERDMAAELGISVGTLRKALAVLTDKGLLDRRQGSGNYIRAAGKVDSVYALFRLELVAGGGLPTAQVLSVETLAKPPDLPAFGRDRTGHRIRRLRRLNARPAAVEEIWLDGSFAPEIAAGELSESLYLFYQKKLGLWIQRAEDRIGTGAMPEWGSGLIPDAPKVLGQVDRLSWDQSNQTVEFSRTWFDPEHVRYVSRLK
ncbi:MAG: GntR family transcriptional regulator [Rhodobacter sp.]|nr:GntR family transcriptional regulator [Rhodobacter sp.]